MSRFLEKEIFGTKSLIAEFKETSTPGKEINFLIKNLLNFSNDLYAGQDLEISITKAVKLDDLFCYRKTKQKLVSEKEINALKIFLRELKGLKKLIGILLKEIEMRLFLLK